MTPVVQQTFDTRELFQHIFLYLSTSDLRCVAVCKKWQKNIEELVQSWLNRYSCLLINSLEIGSLDKSRLKSLTAGLHHYLCLKTNEGSLDLLSDIPAIWRGAIAARRVDVLEIIISKLSQDITAEELNEAFRDAAWDKHVDIVTAFLNSKRSQDITAEEFIRAFVNAAWWAVRANVITALLNSKRSQDITAGKFCDAFVNAVLKGYLCVVTALLNSKRCKTISITQFEDGLFAAVEENRTFTAIQMAAAMVTAIINSERFQVMSPRDLNELLKTAVSRYRTFLTTRNTSGGFDFLFTALLVSARSQEITIKNLEDTLDLLTSTPGMSWRTSHEVIPLLTNAIQIRNPGRFRALRTASYF